MKAKVFLQYIIPQHLLSRTIGLIASSNIVWLKNILIRWFIRCYKVDLSEALESKVENYMSFNDFFTRALRSGARPIYQEPNIVVSPVDCRVSQVGDIEEETVIQAKGLEYKLPALLSSKLSGICPQFKGGRFITLYLSPADYHRIHMPFAGCLKKVIYVPGRLFSVNPPTVAVVDNLYTKNERAILLFETEKGPMLMVLVGAMLVAGIETVWQGRIAPSSNRRLRDWEFSEQVIEFAKGEEIGRFQFGSTVIVLFPADVITWADDISAESRVKMGASIAKVLH